MSLSLPIYFLGRTFVLHTRINGHQFKRSLKTADPLVAKLRALELLKAVHMIGRGGPKITDFSFGAEALRRYEVDLRQGILKADGPDDHARMMQAIKAMAKLAPVPRVEPLPAEPVAEAKAELTIEGLLEKFLALKPKTSEGTVTDYKATVKQFSDFAKNPALSKVGDHVTGYMEWLAERGNTERTIDKKVGTLRALMNFAKKQKYFSGENPAAERNLLTRKQKNANGHKFYQLDEVKRIFGCEEFKALAKTEPNFHLMAVAGLVTGVRVSALAALTAADLKVSVDGVRYLRIRKDKTQAGIRNVPVPQSLFEKLEAYLKEHGGFGFSARGDGKGASDPVRKLLNEHLARIGMAGQDFTFHGLRKTLNNFLVREKVEFEARCQFIGHEVDHVNLGVYAEPFSVEELAEKVGPAQEKLLALIGFM